MKAPLFLVAVALIFAMNVFFVGHFSIPPVHHSASPSADFQAPSTRKAAKESSVQFKSPVSAKYPPVSCRELLAANRNAKQNVSDPNGSYLYGRFTVNRSTRTSMKMPSFWISLHNKEFDATRWSLYETGEYYEKALSAHFVKILTANTTDDDSPLHVIDVGGNIGYFSLLSVASALQAGRRIIVDAFEPNPRNHMRFCESLHMNQWLDHPDVAVNLYPVGVTAPEKSGTIGMMYIGTSGSQGIGNPKEPKAVKGGTWSFPLLSLDELGEELGWFDKEEPMSAATTILKVDIEGLELDAFVGARKLIASGRVLNIFSEGNIRDPREIRDFQITVNQMVESGYKVHKIGGWMGPDENLLTIKFPKAFGGVQDQLYIHGLVGECAGFGKRKRNQCNLWWLPQNEQEKRWASQ